MKQYSTFIFESYAWKPHAGTVELTYSLDDEVSFTETITIPSPPFLKPEKAEDFDRALFALHLIGGISYFKTCLPKKMEIRSGVLNAAQAKFWNDVYENGLGEFFYKNDIDFHGLINFPHPLSPAGGRGPGGGGLVAPKKDWEKRHRTLVPIGGGKDSVVTAELLRGKADLTLFRMGHHPLIDRLAQELGLPLLTINRELPAELFKLNAAGALNGHVPITAYLSFVTIMIGILYDFDSIAMSNEKSANVGNVEFKGKEINHQWSKSQEFEDAFRTYVHTFISNRVEYKSELRSMTELQIAEIFTKHPKYFHCTTSCNTNWKILSKKIPGAAMNPSGASGSWCGTCPKCAFVFALYSAFLPKETVVEIFGKNLFEDAALVPLYKELLGLEGFKPFECVGTPEETKEAMALSKKHGFTPPAA
ncbi:endonuclease domain-containing protein [Candidatus Peribacteria bacterium]|nr:endonuclease domain-containing protein [Candidatus Peribacteria bacterium]